MLYSATLGAVIPVSLNAPEWKEIGSVINSRDNTSLIVEFLSEGPEVVGNDYAIDDISSVSYTHLDVYKRQNRGRGPALHQ